ncbi:MAG: urate hydroxylase PuuD [Deltaproteobacteria bacterium]|nr:urate hydroxylase PuuD [Deltaproteobacteria bacterium]
MGIALLSSEGLLFILRWLHFVFGIIWIGHLYYFNFTQTPFMAETDAATKAGVVQKLVPRALWWFRWGAMFTFITGWLIIGHRLSTIPGMLGSSWGLAILTGGLLGSLMWYNVWFVIWPNQKVVIQSAVQVAGGGQAIPEAAGLASRASVVSRTNVLFSIPMLFFMGAASHLPITVTATNLTGYWVAFAVILGLLQYNALKGKLGPMATVKGVIHMGVLLTLVLYFAMELLTKV